MKILGLIPSRFGSTRFPGKPLADMKGKTLVQRVYENALKVGFDELIVATDNEVIANNVKSFHGKVVLTSPKHPSGTDRCAEVLSILNTSFDVVVNIQGDEPFVDPKQLKQIMECFKDENVQIATLIAPLNDPAKIESPNVVKCVKDKNDFAMYFSRSIIPFPRSTKEVPYFQHLGVYAYRTDILRELAKLPSTILEETEGLEQLRWLENSYRIKTVVVDKGSIGIDTPEDLEEAIKKYL